MGSFLIDRLLSQIHVRMLKRIALKRKIYLILVQTTSFSLHQVSSLLSCSALMRGTCLIVVVSAGYETGVLCPPEAGH